MNNQYKPSQKSSPSMLWYTIAGKIAVVALILAAVLSILMVANYLQTKSIDPLNSQAIALLMRQLQDDPENSTLKDQIRALDLLARKAYFTHQWQLRKGSYLLFIFMLVALALAKYRSSFHTRLPDVFSDPAYEQTGTDRLLARRYIIFGGAGLFILAMFLGFLSQKEWNRSGTDVSSAENPSAAFPDSSEIKKNWPSFRGPDGNGQAYFTDVPTEWEGSSGKNIIWKRPLSLPGFNSPIIWEKKIFFSGADRNTQSVYCLDADSGEMLWEREVSDVPGSPENKPRISDDTGYAAPTMATDGKNVYVIFATGDTAAYDLNGKRIWAKNLGIPDNHYGHSSSLITYQDLLLVQYDQNTGGRLLALKTGSGEIAYDIPRDVDISWASPILVNTGRRAELILNSNPSVFSYDPRTGRELWHLKCMQGEVAPSVAYADGMVFVVNEYARLAAIRLGTTPELAWEYIDDLSEVSSPLATKDLVFMAASYGTVTCFNGKTGDRYWLQEFDEGFYSSPILVGDRVFLMDMEGITYIFAADKEYRLINRNELGEKAVTIPAFMHNRIYIRGEKNLICIGKK